MDWGRVGSGSGSRTGQGVGGEGVSRDKVRVRARSESGSWIEAGKGGASPGGSPAGRLGPVNPTTCLSTCSQGGRLHCWGNSEEATRALFLGGGAVYQLEKTVGLAGSSVEEAAGQPWWS